MTKARTADFLKLAAVMRKHSHKFAGWREMHLFTDAPDASLMAITRSAASKVYISTYVDLGDNGSQRCLGSTSM